MDRRKHSERSVIFLIPDQFGYSAGYFYYCKYLLEFGYKVGVICIDSGKPKIILDGNIYIYYVTPKSKFSYRLQLIKALFSLKDNYDTYILKYFSGVSLCTFFLKRSRVFLDIRSGSVRKNQNARNLEDFLIRKESAFFKNIFILSKKLAYKLNLPTKKTIWLTLGADEIAQEEKDYINSMNLLYIGTFFNRNIHECIVGFAKFYRQYHQKIEITFDIIGKGFSDDENKIHNEISNNNLDGFVCSHGELTHQQAFSYFKKCNYGVSFIPMTVYYKFQPPTKTFEYILSGMVCIATNTEANKELISEANGILHNDNAESFYKALVEIYNKRRIFNTQIIKESLKDYSWKNIVEHILLKEMNR